MTALGRLRGLVVEGLAELWVVYPGPRRYRLAPRVEVIPIGELATRLADR
jgi:hypothetical protein